ncbi:protein FAM32A-like [Toxorhynchites rutilus septentrionalis]|uniref:protein FAM32A-like n=1 Tax=Toxorhynchites rutilus septentrionalis TaxID=329112 RepID=UPI00247A8EF6|nr:protein FAM32A-like [Toxorhynchites rutilus septentrionalis]
MAERYQFESKNKLKVKCDSVITKKKKGEDKEKIREKLAKSLDQSSGEGSTRYRLNVTEEQRDEMVKTAMESIKRMKEREKKKRVEKFNQHMESLAEDFDSLKVSWAK